ncbi:hypothetical protein EJ04DRAFT_574548 [Polyplosphaeria fusca]|uniref:Uncharacterized protein n=1 Tax=Polyplosphaeria fusca TaxID=682080 RepID=A0A9P4V2N5_9PLEO|nr:hypothetical protein EJ04DRAFT_574548 [Polyplosphaeria fusca]
MTREKVAELIEAASVNTVNTTINRISPGTNQLEEQLDITKNGCIGINARIDQMHTSMVAMRNTMARINSIHVWLGRLLQNQQQQTQAALRALLPPHVIRQPPIQPFTQPTGLQPGNMPRAMPYPSGEIS